MATRTILYYPTINIPSNSWLRHSLLYWDEVSSIIPQSWGDRYLYELSPDIHYLIDEGQFRAIKPDELILKGDNWEAFHEFQTEFKTTIESPQFKNFIQRKPFSLSGIHIDKVRESNLVARVHSNKTSDNLFHFLEDLGLAKRDRQNHEWLMFERHTALIYMSLLAKYLADVDKKQTTIGTDYGVYEKFNFKRVREKEGFPVVSLNLSNVLPTPIANVPLEKIIDFKRQRKDELLNFRKILMEFQSKISKAKSNGELKEIAVSFQENIKGGVKGISATLKDSRIETVFKSFKSLINLKSPTTIVSAAALANEKYHFFDTPISLKIAGLATVGLLELTGNYIELRNKQLAKTRDSAFSYLLQAQRSGIIKAIR
jgi:hypothetical protein